MDEDTLPSRNDFLDDFYNPSCRNPNSGVRRQTRHVVSHVDFIVNATDVERIPENENLRRKHRTKCQQCASCCCQQIHENHSGDTTRKNENSDRKNSEKSQATLCHRMDNAASECKNFPMKNHRTGSGSHQRSQNHRPGTSFSHCQNRNNSLSSGAHRQTEKYDNLSCHDRSRLDSPPRGNVNSDLATKETDYRPSYEQMPLRNMRKDSDVSWRTPPGEPHSETEPDSPTKTRHNDYFDSKQRHSGQGESVLEENCFEDGKPSLEPGSSGAKDGWQQYEREQRELKDLNEDLRQFVKRKMSSGQVSGGKKERDDVCHETLEKINLFVSKLPVPRQKKLATRTSSKSREKRSSSPKERMKIRTSKIDARKTYHSSRIDEAFPEERKDQELRRKLEDELLDIQLESSKLDEDEEEDIEEENEGKENDDAGSETEEEARQLLKEETDMELLNRALKKSSSVWKEEEGKNSRDAGDKLEKKISKPGKAGRHSKEKTGRESFGTRDEEPEISCERDFAIDFKQPNYYEDRINRENHFKDEFDNRESMNFRKIRRNGRDEKTSRDEAREKMYQRANSVLDVTRKKCNPQSGACGNGDIGLETNKTRTCIDEMIDSGLSREAKRENCGPHPPMKKDFPHEDEVTERVSLKRSSNIAAPDKIIPEECFCQTLTRHRETLPIATRTNEEISRIKRDDCFCQRIVKILADHPTRREYVRKLKNRRWDYLDDIQNVLAKLYDLERFLDSCSPERGESSIVKRNIDENSRSGSEKKFDKRTKERFPGES